MYLVSSSNWQWIKCINTYITLQWNTGFNNPQKHSLFTIDVRHKFPFSVAGLPTQLKIYDLLCPMLCWIRGWYTWRFDGYCMPFTSLSTAFYLPTQTESWTSGSLAWHQLVRGPPLDIWGAGVEFLSSHFSLFHKRDWKLYCYHLRILSTIRNITKFCSEEKRYLYVYLYNDLVIMFIIYHMNVHPHA